MPDEERDTVPQTDPVPVDFEAWVEARGAALQRFAWLVTGSATDAPDLVQDALVRAWPRWSKLVAAGTAEAYVRRSIVNASISRWRKHGRVTPVEDVEVHMTATYDLDPTGAQAAWQLCQVLPPAQRAAVVLRFYEELSFAEIAAILDCAEATARSHVHRALRALRARIDEGVDDD